MSAPRVLILGGGYTAIHLCRALAPAIREGKVDATVVNRENYHVFHGFVGEMLTGRVSPSHILSPARRIFPPAKVHVGEIQKINLRSKFITTARSIDGARVELPFDQIVVALGSVDRAEAYPGLAEHAFKLKTYEDVLRLEGALQQNLSNLIEVSKVEVSADDSTLTVTIEYVVRKTQQKTRGKKRCPKTISDSVPHQKRSGECRRRPTLDYARWRPC